MTRNKFAGADDIYLTKKCICVKRCSSSRDKSGNYFYHEKKNYYPKTRKNLVQAKSLYGFIPSK